MEFEYSPGHSSGSALHLLSPAHAHHPSIEVFPSIRQLRRSLSRSPSRSSKFSLYTTRSGNTSPSAAVSPSSLARAHSVDTASELSLKPKYSVKRNGVGRTSVRRTSPKSPLRRALSDNTNQANVNTSTMPAHGDTQGEDQENKDLEKQKETWVVEPSRLDFLKVRAEKLLQHPLCEQRSPVKSSPLKRSDGVMNLEVASFGSPRAKRRSLHGTSSFGNDFNIFDQNPNVSTATRGVHSDDNKWFRDSGVAFSSTWPAVTRSPSKRSLNLRKSTLQQRSAPKPKFSFDVTSDAISSPQANQARSRTSLDSALPLRTIDFESPFRRSTASDPPVLFPPPGQRMYHSAPKPHPLSHALSPSSSSSSMVDEAPKSPPRTVQSTFIKPDVPKRPGLFSKSLPIGALRPEQTDDNCSQGSFATPHAYKMVKPAPQAFMSTGLISKRNRDMSLQDNDFGNSMNMPDTPSKKAHILINNTPAPGLGRVAPAMHEFGSPSTPFNGRVTRVSPQSFGKGVNIFGSHIRAPQLTRSGSFIGINGDDTTNSPTHRLESQPSLEDLPPTPTKSCSTVTRPQSKGKTNSLRSSLFGRRTSLAVDTFTPPDADDMDSRPDEDGKCIAPIQTPCGRTEKIRQLELDDSTVPTFALGDHAASPSLHRSDAFDVYRQQHSPSSPVERASSRLLSTGPSTSAHAETNIFAGSNPNAIPESGTSPHTPNDSFAPPDPSRLSISAEHKAPTFFNGSTATLPPATPTGPRDQAFGVSKGQSNASSGYFANDVDTALTSRFAQVTSVGIGEFSQVYRVEKPIGSQSTIASFSKSSSAGNVWAVKKTRKPYTGNKDRQRKMREVDILRAVRGHEHVVELFDVWEAKGHLYIQTEYCENGNLKDFLSQTGNKGRLDDFRIWKILLELAQGIKAIHDASYIHLDLKPANVFIDWEGVLKIGDFGMASTWPAPPGLDGEGDREYIGPEVLSGRFDKPADIFALGMIMLEIAGNIVLPDNGMSWQRLRAGDLSDLPSLTWSSESSLVRNESGDPVDLMNQASTESLCTSNPGEDDLSFLRTPRPNQDRCNELVDPPNFMIDPSDPEALESAVQWMLCPDPDQRPLIDHLLMSGGVQWVDRRRRAGATIYEGNWGPADEVLSHFDNDIEMSDF